MKMGNDALHGEKLGGDHLSEAKSGSPPRIRTVLSEGERSSEGVYVDIKDVMNLMSTSPQSFSHFRSLSFDKVESKLTPSRKSLIFSIGDEQLRRSYSLDSFDPLKNSMGTHSPGRPLNEPPAIQRKVQEIYEIQKIPYVEQNVPKVLPTIKLESAEEASAQLQKREETHRELMERYHYTIDSIPLDKTTNVNESDVLYHNDRIGTLSVLQELANVPDSRDIAPDSFQNLLTTEGSDPPLHAAIYEDNTNSLRGTINVQPAGGADIQSAVAGLESDTIPKDEARPTVKTSSVSTVSEHIPTSTIDPIEVEDAEPSILGTTITGTKELSTPVTDADTEMQTTLEIEGMASSEVAKRKQPVGLQMETSNFQPMGDMDSLFEIGEADDTNPDALFTIGDDDEEAPCSPITTEISHRDKLVQPSTTVADEAVESKKMESKGFDQITIDKTSGLSPETKSRDQAAEIHPKDALVDLANEDDLRTIMEAAASDHSPAIIDGEFSFPISELEESLTATDLHSNWEGATSVSESQAGQSSTTVSGSNSAFQSTMRYIGAASESAMLLQNTENLVVTSDLEKSIVPDLENPGSLMNDGGNAQLASEIKADGEAVHHRAVSDWPMEAGEVEVATSTQCATDLVLESRLSEKRLNDANIESLPVSTESMDAEAMSSATEVIADVKVNLNEADVVLKSSELPVTQANEELEPDIAQKEASVNTFDGNVALEVLVDGFIQSSTEILGQSSPRVGELGENSAKVTDSRVQGSGGASQSHTLNEQNFAQPNSTQLSEGESTTENANSANDQVSDFDVLKKKHSRSRIGSACPSDEDLDFVVDEGEARVDRQVKGGDAGLSSGLRTFPSDEGLYKAAFGMDTSEYGANEVEAHAWVDDDFSMVEAFEGDREAAKTNVVEPIHGFAESEIEHGDTKRILQEDQSSGLAHDPAFPRTAEPVRIDETSDQPFSFQITNGTLMDEIDTDGVDFHVSDGEVDPDYMADFDALVSDAETELMALLGAVPLDETAGNNDNNLTQAPVDLLSQSASTKDQISSIARSGHNTESDLAEDALEPLASSPEGFNVSQVTSKFESTINNEGESKQVSSNVVVEFPAAEAHLVRSSLSAEGNQSSGPGVSSTLEENRAMEEASKFPPPSPDKALEALNRQVIDVQNIKPGGQTHNESHGLTEASTPSAPYRKATEQVELSEQSPRSLALRDRDHAESDVSSSKNEFDLIGSPSVVDDHEEAATGTVEWRQTIAVSPKYQQEESVFRFSGGNSETAVFDPLLGQKDLEEASDTRTPPVPSASLMKTQKLDSLVTDHPQSPNSMSDSHSSYSRGHDFKRLDSLSASRNQLYDQSSTFGNKSTISSMSSTISPGSTVRGLLASGIVTPANAEELLLLLQGSVLGPTSEKPTSNSNRPPLFPRKKDYFENPSVLVELLSAKLLGQVPTSGNALATHKPETRWIKHSSAAFATKESVFAQRSDASSLSPPGSPPEPIYDEALERDSEDSSEDDSQITAFPVDSSEEVAAWDMIYEPNSEAMEDHIKSRKPTFVVMPELDSPLYRQIQGKVFDWSDSSYAAELPSPRISTDDLRGDSSHRSLSRGRRGRTRRLSLSSKGSSRKSTLSKGVMRPRTLKQAVTSDIRMVRSEGMVSAKNSPSNSECDNFGGFYHREAGEILDASRTHKRFHFQKSASVPNLFRPSTSTMISRVKSSGGKSVDDHGVSPQGSSTATLAPPLFTEPLGVSNERVKKIEESSVYRRILSSDVYSMRENSNIPSEQRPLEAVQLDSDLLSFASVTPALFPTQCGELLASIQYMCSKKWEQLLACWKHEDVLRSMSTRRCSPHFCRESNLCGSDSETIRSQDSAVRARAFELHLRGLKFPGYSGLNDVKNLDGFSPNHGENHTYTLSRFLPEIENMCSTDDGQLMHGQSDSSPSALIQEATRLVQAFERFIADSVKNIESETSWSNSRIGFHVCVKRLESIRLKAARKYESDTSRVKDVLRARIIFPAESALVCWLVNLRKKAKDWSSNSSISSLEVVRVKNLFRSRSPLGGFQTSSLPTGYRHVLINLRINKSFLAEVQLNLSHMYDVLGNNGCSLHSELCNLDAALLNVATADVMLSFSTEFAEIFARFRGELTSSSEDGQYRQRNQSDVSHRILPSAYEDAVTPVRQNLSSVSSPRDIQQLFVPDLTEETGLVDFEVNAADDKSSGGADAALTGTASNTDTTKLTGQKLMNDRNPEAPRRPRDELPPHVVNQVPGPASLLLDLLQVEIHQVDQDVLFMGMFEAARIHLEEDPRDIAALCCLYTILHFVGDNKVNRRYFHPAMENFKIGLIKQSLSLCHQSISTGMTGWVENGTDDKQQFAGRLFSLLQSLSLALAERCQWKDARKVLETLVLLCEQRLPLYHPTTLSSMFDLARMAQKLGDGNFAKSMIERVANRASFYLAEMEDKAFSHLEQCLSDRTSRVPVFRIDSNRDAVIMLHAFVSSFKDHIDVKRGTIFEEHEEINLVEEHLFADSVSVLANCVKAQCVILGNSDGSSFYWRVGASHYQRLFDRFSQFRGLSAVPTLSAARGLARCLRELGKGVNAIEFLGKLVAASEMNLKSENDSTIHVVMRNHTPGVRFLNKNHEQEATSEAVAKRVSLALCYWQMAVLTTDCHPTEEGRVEALNLLRSASLALREAFPKIPDSDEAIKELCADALQKVEEEAKAIFVPMSVE